ncbi:hypothetical protein HUT06_29030 [Actinomadura sp. NAK00032]|uniref:hypothetical protein n=1 Tax=Actinomadura sp. NAK00032 TaxID=2742128 RepID=UPI001591282F|nr:hypothetical protein [Actinomadura sp. NAK00032]QKW37553.1 hypothetical protein HUT06_29030 [Actinomadura sp. NAK00032]
MYCSTCGDERVFEQPPCPDGHGAECPERACTECGTAILVGLPPVTAAPRATGPAPVPAPDPATVRAPGGAATARAVA